MHSVTWCGDRFVAVGEIGTILVSTDGLSWKNHSLDTAIALQSVACSGNRFVAVGDMGSIFTSEDAEVWTPRESGTNGGLFSVIRAGNLWVVVGNQVILTSPDGLVWDTALASPPQEYFYLTSVAWNGERLVATGSLGSGLGVILTSTDGKAWSNPGATTTATSIHSVIWTGTTFASVAGDQIKGTEFLTSADGLTWESRPMVGDVFSSSQRNLLWDGTRYMRGGSGSIATSPEGVTWSATPVDTRFPVNSLAKSGSRYVAVGGWGDMLVSLDGVEWTLLTETQGWFFRDITWAGDKFVAVGDESIVLTSGDGVAWEPISRKFDSSLAISSILWTGNRLVAFANRNVAMTSPDGKAWTLHEYSPPSEIGNAVWTGNTIVAAGGDGIYFSKEGADWTFKPFPSQVPFPKVAWNGSRFVVAGMGKILVSSDGDSWSPQSFDSTFIPVDIAWSGTRFVVAGDEDILTSSDGQAWTRQSMIGPHHFSKVTWTGTQFLAVDLSGYVFSSADGMAWTRQFSGTQMLTGIAYNDNLIVLTGYYGAILSSPRLPPSNAVIPRAGRLEKFGMKVHPGLYPSQRIYSVDGRLLGPLTRAQPSAIFPMHISRKESP